MKTRNFVALCLLVVVMLSAACSAPQAQSTGKISPEAQKYANLKGNVDKGKSSYAGTCVSCHGPDAKGMPGLGKDMTTSTFIKGLSDPELILFLTKGRPSSDPANTTKVDMPPRGGNPALKDQDLADIVTFIRTLQK